MKFLLSLLLLAALPAAAQEVCKTSTTTWQNTPFPAQRDSFVVEYDDTPNAAGLDAHTALAARVAGAYSGLAVTTRFNSVNKIDAYNGTGYAAAASVPYVAGTRYHFRLLVRVPTHRFTAYVRPAGGAEVLLAQDFRFRSTQDTVAALSYWVVYASTALTHTVCNWTLTPLSAPPPPPPPPPGVVVKTVTIVPGATTLIATQRQQLYAVVSLSDGTVLAAPTLQWASTNTAVATVDARGVVVAPAAGTAIVSATDASGVSGQAQFTVGPQDFLSVEQVRVTNFATPKLIRLPAVVPGFPFVPLGTGYYLVDLLSGAGTVVGHGVLTVSP